MSAVDQETPFFVSKLLPRIDCSAKGTNEQHWILHDRMLRMWFDSASTNKRKEAWGFLKKCRMPIPSNPKSGTDDRTKALQKQHQQRGKEEATNREALNSPNEGVMAHMDTFVTSYYRPTNSGSNLALLKFRQPFRTGTDLWNHIIEHDTNEQCAGHAMQDKPALSTSATGKGD